MTKRNAFTLLPLVFALVFAAAGCADERPASSASDSVSSESALDDASAANGDAPNGCRRVGEILCDADLEGYVRDATTGLATSVTYGDLRLSDVLSAGKQRYAMVFLSAYW